MTKANSNYSWLYCAPENVLYTLQVLFLTLAIFLHICIDITTSKIWGGLSSNLLNFHFMWLSHLGYSALKILSAFASLNSELCLFQLVRLLDYILTFSCVLTPGNSSGSELGHFQDSSNLFFLSEGSLSFTVYCLMLENDGFKHFGLVFLLFKA